eukprot:m.161625 g.161625  ORF g.161625 m.161625 type:complete len:635 (+) comp12098_c0_seq1:64-1968(+)
MPQKKDKAKAAKAKRQAQAIARKTGLSVDQIIGDDTTNDKGGGGDEPTKEELKSEVDSLVNPGITGVEDPKSAMEGGVTHRTCTGELAMVPGARDIKVVNFSLSFHGENLIEDTTLELNYGRRYGLVGRNGSGKSTFLEALAFNDLELPPHIDKYLLRTEADPTDNTAMQEVISFAKQEVARLNAVEEKILTEDGPDSELLQPLYERLDELDPETFEQRAGAILWGLGFDKEMMKRATKDMSGGWRMRVALARALFVAPTLLLLDEPTNHLDLETCVWLERYLANYPKILLLISHSQDFLNGTCTNIMHLTANKKLEDYKGNYATYVKTREEKEVNQLKEYEKQQEEIRHIKKFIASCGTFANAVKQAQSRQKVLDKMIEKGLIEKPAPEPVVKIQFPNNSHIPPPVMAFKEVSFAYDHDKSNLLLKDMEFGIDMDSRIVLVGPNGAGKSTLQKLMVGELSSTMGTIQKHGKLQIARYNQHSEEILDVEMTPLDWIMKEFPVPKVENTEWRKRLGRYGISGKAQTRPIETMSDGQKTQLVFAWLAQQHPHLLLFDEPTNHLDMESIDGLADAINKFEGGMVLISHDFRLLQQCAKEIWIVDNHKVTPWQGDIASYKKHLVENFKEYDHGQAPGQ